MSSSRTYKGKENEGGDDERKIRERTSKYRKPLYNSTNDYDARTRCNRSNSYQDRSNSHQGPSSSYQDRRSSYQDRGKSHQDPSTSYQDRGSSHHDHRSSCQDRSSSHQDRRSSYQGRSSSYQDRSSSHHDHRSSYQDRRGSYQDNSNSYQSRSLRKPMKGGNTNKRNVRRSESYKSQGSERADWKRFEPQGKSENGNASRYRPHTSGASEDYKPHRYAEHEKDPDMTKIENFSRGSKARRGFRRKKTAWKKNLWELNGHELNYLFEMNVLVNKMKSLRINDDDDDVNDGGPTSPMRHRSILLVNPVSQGEECS